MRLACLGVVIAACLLAIDRSVAEDLYHVVVHPQEVTVDLARKVSLRAYLYRGKELQFEWPWKFTIMATAGRVAGHNYHAPAEPGRYRVLVGHAKVRQASGRAVAYVNVRGARPLAMLKLVPAAPRLKPGESVKLTLTARDNVGRIMSYRPIWSAVGGQLTGEGHYTAPRKPGVYRVTVQGPRGIQAGARIVVSSPKPVPHRLVITPSHARLSPGKSVQLKATVLDREGNRMSRGRLVWAAKGGLISTTGRFTAGDGEGTYPVTVKHSSGLIGRGSIQIALPDGTRLAIRIEPSRATVKPGQRISFTPVLTSSGQPIKTWPWEYEFSASSGSFSSNVFTAPERSARVQIRIRHRSHKATGTALVIVKIPLAQLVIQPSAAELQPGQSRQFTVTGRDASGGVVPVQAVWSATGGKVAAGRFTAGVKVGTFQLAVRDQPSGKTAQVPILITRPPRPEPAARSRPSPSGKPGAPAKPGAQGKLTSPAQPGGQGKPRSQAKPRNTEPVTLVVTPARLAARPGQTVAFSASLWRASEKIWTLPWEFVWRADGGQLAKNSYTAPRLAGTYRISATYKGKGKFVGHAEVVVSPASAARVVISPTSVALKPEQRVHFKARLLDARGSRLSGTIRWRATGGQITDEGVFTAAKRSGLYRVSAHHGGFSASARVEVSYPYQIRLQPKTETVDPGGRITFMPALFRGGQLLWSRPREYTYLSSKGRFEGNVFVAPKQPGRYTVEIRFKQRATSKAVVVVRPPKIFRIVIAPGRVQLKAGQTQLFKALAYDVDGEPLAWQPKWRATGGTVDRRGVFTAGVRPGWYRIEALLDSGRPRGRADVQIVGDPAFKILLAPGQVRLQPGETVRFKATLEKGGKPLWADPQDFRFAAEHGSFTGALYTAPVKPGRDRVTVRYGKGVSTAWVDVSVGKAVRLDVFPLTVRLKPGEKQPFRAQGRDAAGREVKFEPVWTAQGGSIDARGVFQAGTVPGTYKIRAVGLRSKAFGLATVIIAGGDDFTALGRRWARDLKSKRRSIHELTDFLIIKVLYAKMGQIASFRRAFITQYNQGGKTLFYTAWYSVLYEFGEYYGREVRRNTTPRREPARFVKGYILRLSSRDQQEFREGFEAGYRQVGSGTVYREILTLAKQIKQK